MNMPARVFGVPGNDGQSDDAGLFYAGELDVESGTRDKRDRRFEPIYEKYFGPLYYSIDFRDLHIITLYSEGSTSDTPAISTAQLAWLAADLDRAFESRKIAHVFVIVHRPLWRENAGELGTRCIGCWWNLTGGTDCLTVEGVASGDSSGKSGPRVEAVFAGHARAFCQDPQRDDIGYYMLGPLGGRVQGDAAAGQLQHYTMVHVDTSGVHLALVRPGNVLPENFVVAQDHDVLTKIAALDEKTLGIDGVLEQTGRQSGGSTRCGEGNADSDFDESVGCAD